jgi:plastocyanin
VYAGNYGGEVREKPDPPGRKEEQGPSNSTRSYPMNRAFLLFAAAAVALGLAAPASTHSSRTLIIRHQTSGCHTWGLAGGTYNASQSLTLTRGQHLTIGNNDVMPHRLVQLSGPALRLGSAANLNTMGKTVEIRFTKAGVYRFTTKPGEDYTSGIKTTGEDNVLRLRVTVRA